MTFRTHFKTESTRRVSRAIALVVALLLVAVDLTPVGAEPTSTLVTCINLQTKTERISKTGKCRITHEAQANWHLLQSDSRLPEKDKSKTLVICSNKPTSSVSYQIIRARCARHQLRSEFYRSNLLVPAPKITNVIATGHDSAQISIATDPNANPDTPVAYYTIKSSKGQVKNVYTWGELKLTIDSLSELTDYSFTVSATTADGTSQLSLPSDSVKTAKYVAPPALASVAAPVAQVSLVSSETATVSIPVGATKVAVPAPALGNPTLSFANQSSVVSATFQAISNPVGGSATPFTVSGSTKIVDISVSGLTGSVTVCLDASPTAKLWHFVSGAWVDITTSRTSTQVCGVTSSFSPFTGEEQLPAPAFTLSSSTESRRVNAKATGFTANSTGGAISSYSISATPSGMRFNTSTGALTGAPTTIAAATTYTITGTNPSGTATRTFSLTVTAPDISCADGGECYVGDRGPGGGIVFYVAASNFTSSGSSCNTSCRYLEVAPSTWRSGSVANDLTYVWSNLQFPWTGQDTVTVSTQGLISNRVRPGYATERLNWMIGEGFNNTRLMKVAGATSAAQAAVLAYGGAGSLTTGQWFIPSANELNELCKYARGQETGDTTVACDSSGTIKSTENAGTDLGGFLLAYYWSSTESNEEDASVVYQTLNGGRQSSQSKAAAITVRPIRAF